MIRLSKLLGAPAIVAAALAASVLGCAPAEAPRTGALHLSTAAVVPEVVRVTTVLSGPILPQIVYDLAPSADGSWSTAIEGLPPGAIHVEVGAFNAAGLELFHGRGDATIVAGAVASLQIFAQELAPPPSYGNNPPHIDAIAVSSLSMATGASVTMNVAASDPDAGASLTYLWRASGGTFADANASVTQWTAPAAAGVQTIFVTVRDEKGAAAEASFTVTVADSTTLYGTLALAVTLNRAPVVADIAVAPSRVDVGESTTVTATVSDRDGDAVSVQWTSDCPGTFGSPNAASTTFTPMNLAAAGMLCRLQLYADDGHGGSATGWTGLWVGPPPPVGPIAPPPPPPPGNAGFVNGSFETGDYTGWQLLAFPLPYSWDGPPSSGGGWTIGRNLEAIYWGMPVYDYSTGTTVLATSPILPYGCWPSDGQFAAIQIPNAPGAYRLSQRITVPGTASSTTAHATFSLEIESMTSEAMPGVQSVAVHIRDLNDIMLATPFVTGPSFELGGNPKLIDVDLTPFMGMTIVFDVEIAAHVAPIAVQLDGFQLN
jgi:hypothetical protein